MRLNTLYQSTSIINMDNVHFSEIERVTYHLINYLVFYFFKPYNKRTLNKQIIILLILEF